MERRQKAPGAATQGKQRRNIAEARENNSRINPGMRWIWWLSSRLILPTVILLGVAVCVLWVRLAMGPISLKPIAAPIARAIAADLPGLDVTVEDANVVWVEGRGLEFRLHHIKVLDARGTIAQAPDAAIRLSSAAIWNWRLAPSRIILIDPSLLLRYSRDGGFSLAFTDAQPSPDVAVPPRRDGEPVVPGQAGPAAELGAALGAILSQAGSSSGAASFIRGIGLRNATLAIDNAGGQRAIFRIREADIGVDNRRDGRMIGASLMMDSSRGPWNATVVANLDQASGASTLDLRLTDLVPSALASALPWLGPLAALDFTVSGTTSLKLGAQGEITGAAAEIEVGKGSIAPGLRGHVRMPLESGKISAQYDPVKRRLSFSTTRLTSGASSAAFRGAFQLASEAGKPIGVEIASTEGQLAAPEFGVAPKSLDAFQLQAAVDQQSGAIDIAELFVKAGGGEVQITGRVPPSGGPGRLLLQGRLSPMPVETMKLMWPSVIAPTARNWSGRQVQQGRLVTGTFTIEDTGAAPGGAQQAASSQDRDRAIADTLRIAVALEGSNVRMQPKPGFAPVEAPRVLVRLESNALEVAAPEAVIHTTPQRRLPVRGVRLVASDVTAPNAMGDLTFRAQGQLQPALDLAEQQAARSGRSLTLPGENLEGRVDGQVRILVPLGDDVTAEDTRVDIKARVSEGRARGVFGGWDVSGAGLAVEINDQQLDIKGDMLVQGVPAKISTRRIFAATDGEQPPILISANLDTGERTQLGLDINEFVVGDVPIEVLIAPRAQGEPQVQVRANLTNTELLLEPLAWKKAVGRPATLQFEVARPSRQRTELHGFRIVGEDLSLAGTLVLDQRNKLREFNFNELALHVVSRLQVSGTLRNDNVWDVTARGQTLDGRDFFKSLLSFSQIRAKPLPPRKDQSGLDIKVDIENVLGHQDVALKGLKMQMSNRGGRTIAMTARGTVDSGGRQAGAPLDVTITQVNREARRLIARSEDAGQVFRLIGFFPNMVGGTMSLDVNLDGSGAAEKSGRLNVWNFAILGDAMSGEAPDALEHGAPQRGQRRTQQRSRLDFISMNAPFELGHGQIVIRDADLRGQVLGVVLRGKADFRQQTVDLGGTYVPLQGLNSAIGQFPLLGIILAGPRGEGVIGMTFAVQGPMARPQVVVNPASIIPGILREMMQMTNPDPKITPRDAQSAPVPVVEQPKAPAKRPPPRAATPPASRPAGGQVDSEGGWSSGTVKAPAPRAVPRAE